MRAALALRKTTTSLLCWQVNYLGRLHRPAGSGRWRIAYRALPYTSTWLTPEHGRRFPELVRKAHYGNEDEDKLLVPLNETTTRV